MYCDWLKWYYGFTTCLLKFAFQETVEGYTNIHHMMISHLNLHVFNNLTWKYFIDLSWLIVRIVTPSKYIFYVNLFSHLLILIKWILSLFPPRYNWKGFEDIFHQCDQPAFSGAYNKVWKSLYKVRHIWSL